MTGDSALRSASMDTAADDDGNAKEHKGEVKSTGSEEDDSGSDSDAPDSDEGEGDAGSGDDVDSAKESEQAALKARLLKRVQSDSVPSVSGSCLLGLRVA